MNHMMSSYRLNAVKVRLSDSAVLAGAVSLLYALALIVCPRAFPKLLERIFVGQGIFLSLAVLLVAANEILFVLISRRRAQKSDLLTSGYIALLTIPVVLLFQLLVNAADAQTQLSQIFLRAFSPVRDGISSEDLLVYTHVTLVSGIVLPSLLVRLTQNCVPDANSADHDAKVRNATARQQISRLILLCLNATGQHLSGSECAGEDWREFAAPVLKP